MIALSIILLIAVSSFLIWVKDTLYKGFSNPYWMDSDDSREPSVRERLEMENTEYDYGHNVRRIEDE